MPRPLLRTGQEFTHKHYPGFYPDMILAPGAHGYETLLLRCATSPFRHPTTEDCPFEGEVVLGCAISELRALYMLQELAGGLPGDSLQGGARAGMGFRRDAGALHAVAKTFFEAAAAEAARVAAGAKASPAVWGRGLLWHADPAVPAALGLRGGLQWGGHSRDDMLQGAKGSGPPEISADGSALFVLPLNTREGLVNHLMDLVPVSEAAGAAVGREKLRAALLSAGRREEVVEVEPGWWRAPVGAAAGGGLPTADG